jgi:hypothetical protein
MPAEVRAEVVRLRLQEGWTYQRVADEMMARGIPTATGKTKWTPSTVQTAIRTAATEAEYAARIDEEE